MLLGRSYFLSGHLQMMTALLLLVLFSHGLLRILIWISGLFTIRFWTRISWHIRRALGVLRLVIRCVVLRRVEILLLLKFFLMRTLKFCPGMLRVLLWLNCLLLRLVSICFITRLNTIWDRICGHTFCLGIMSSGNHVLVMALPMSIILLLLMVLDWRSHHLLIVIIIYWSLDIVDRLHGVLPIGITTIACINLMSYSRVKGIAHSVRVLRYWMLYFLVVLGRDTNRWTWHIDIPPKIILMNQIFNAILDTLINRRKLLVTLNLLWFLLLIHVFVSLHCCSEWRLDVII